jgi:glycosyltransferase involved in cell wall biosynthesis
MMMHSIPIIASTSTGLSEMVKEGTTGLHIPVMEYPDHTEIDIALLSEKILFLLQNSSLRRKMGLNSRLRYEQIYTLSHMKKSMLALYTSLYND